MSVCLKGAGNKIYAYVEYIRTSQNILNIREKRADICIEFADRLVLSYEDYKKVNMIDNARDYVEKQWFLDNVIRQAIASARGVKLVRFDVNKLLVEFTSAKKTEVIHVRVTPDEKKKLEEEAEKHGMTLSEYIRYKLLFSKGEN